MATLFYGCYFMDAIVKVC